MQEGASAGVWGRQGWVGEGGLGSREVKLWALGGGGPGMQETTPGV